MLDFVTIVVLLVALGLGYGAFKFHPIIALGAGVLALLVGLAMVFGFAGIGILAAIPTTGLVAGFALAWLVGNAVSAVF